MIVCIVLKNGIKDKYTVENLDAGKAIIESYAKQHNFDCRFAEGFITIASRGPGELLAFAQFVSHYDSGRRIEGRACVWSK